MNELGLIIWALSSFIGLAIYGYNIDDFENDIEGGAVVAILFWPILLGFFLIIIAVLSPAFIPMGIGRLIHNFRYRKQNDSQNHTSCSLD